METNPPPVAGMPSRVEDIFSPVWTTVVGGPADEADPGKRLFAAYAEVTNMTTEAAHRLEEHAAPSTSPLRRVEALGEEQGYTRYRNRNGHLFIVRSDGPPHLAATSIRACLSDSLKNRCCSDLVRLAEFANRV